MNDVAATAPGGVALKAIVWTNYGSPDVLQLREVERPTPNENEVLVKVHATTVTLGDCELRSLKLQPWIQFPIRIYMGFNKPKRVTILGQELAGEIVDVGAQVKRFQKGDSVFAPTMLRLGAYAEYITLPEKNVVLKPASLTYEDAATIPTGGINGWHFLNVAHIQPGESLLINGAGGSIGTYAVQIAKTLGAEVTAVDSGEKLAMLRAIGADHVIDYTQEEFTKSAASYDVIVDIVGKSPFSGSIRALKPKGRYILGNPTLSGMIRARWMSMPDEKQVIVAVANYKSEDYASLLGLMVAGKVRPIIDRRYPLAETAAAHRYVDAGHKKGNVIIRVVDG